MAIETWGIVELMGHGKIAGFLTEEKVAGSEMLRVDVPEIDGRPAFTKYFGGGSLFGITPTTKELAEYAAKSFRARPITPWDLPDPARAIPESTGRDEEPDGDDGIPC